MASEFRLLTPVGVVASVFASELDDRITARWHASLVASCERTDLRSFEAGCYALRWEISSLARVEAIRIEFSLLGDFEHLEPSWEGGEHRIGLKWQDESSELKIWTHDTEWTANSDVGPTTAIRLEPTRGGFSSVFQSLGHQNPAPVFAIAWSRTDAVTAAMNSVKDWEIYSGRGVYDQQLYDILFKN